MLTHLIVWFFNQGASVPEIPEGEPCNLDVLSSMSDTLNVLSFISDRPVNVSSLITDTLNVQVALC